MVLRLVALMALFSVGIAGYAQDEVKPEEPKTEKKKKAFRPDIPGNLSLELGVNQRNGLTPVDFKKGFWGSRTFNVYYQYPIRILKSNVSIIPGIGLSLERWKFTNEYTLSPSPIGDGSYPLIPATSVVGGSIDRSQLINNYFEAPIELRYDTNPEDIARSFSVSFGARFGVLYDSFTKIDYEQSGESRSLKDKQWHGMNKTRYALYGKIGVGGFSIFAYFNMTPMFQDGKGPNGTTMTSSTIGIALNGF